METKILEITVRGTPVYIPLFKERDTLWHKHKWQSISSSGYIWRSPEDIIALCYYHTLEDAKSVLTVVTALRGA